MSSSKTRACAIIGVYDLFEITTYSASISPSKNSDCTLICKTETGQMFQISNVTSKILHMEFITEHEIKSVQ